MMPHPIEPTISAEPELIEGAPIKQLTTDYSVEYINAASDPAQANRFLITLVDPKTGAERLVDLLIDSDRFVDIATEVRKHFDYSFELFEIISPSEPF